MMCITVGSENACLQGEGRSRGTVLDEKSVPEEAYMLSSSL